MFLDDIFKTQTLSTDGWEQYKTSREVTLGEPREFLAPHVTSAHYRTENAERVETFGIFFHRGDIAFVAWGFADEEHCKAHIVRQPDGSFSRPIPGCADIVPIIEAEVVVGFSLRALDKVWSWR